MNRYPGLILSACFVAILNCMVLTAISIPVNNSSIEISLLNEDQALWKYTVKETGYAKTVQPPVFEIGGRQIKGTFESFTEKADEIADNGVTEYTYTGKLKEQPDVMMNFTIRLSGHNPVVRFRYELFADNQQVLTKTNGKDNLTYLAISFDDLKSVDEVKLSEFYELEHTYAPSERKVTEGDFTNGLSFMGPIFSGSNDRHSLFISYEHGSQVPDRFIEYQAVPDRLIRVKAVKGNYLDQQPLNKGYQTIWMNLGIIQGNIDELATFHRMHLLNHVSQNKESRKPYIFYNTWNFQERNKAWNNLPYLASMNRERMLQEIDLAHEMGIEVFVIDAGWFSRTGDWEANPNRFPDDLKDVKNRLDQYQMKLGLWFNSDAAITSNMLARNRDNILSYNNEIHPPKEVWETEKSHTMCLVSPFGEDYANELIRVAKKYGVTYFKWDAFAQYGCNAPGHGHGTETNSALERAQNYSFQLPLAMVKVANKICSEIPGAIVDFDVTEGERAFGLAFLEAGKFFTINNGPYYYSFDDPEFAPGGGMGANVLVFPGLARAANARTIARFDKWIPSTLFLTHYLPDDPEYSQWINIGSLILGGNGIWGDLPNVSEEGRRRFHTALEKYKQVRDDVTLAPPVQTGEAGSTPEIHEKINPLTGKGELVVFYNYKNVWRRSAENAFPGTFEYVTHNKVDKSFWANQEAEVTFDNKGRAHIRTRFNGPGALILFFGVN